MDIIIERYIDIFNWSNCTQRAAIATLPLAAAKHIYTEMERVAIHSACALYVTSVRSHDGY